MLRLDRRLLRSAGAVRALLALDAVLGLVAAVLVLAQAGLIAHVAARSFAGAPLDTLQGAFVALVVVVVARAAAVWGFGLAGRDAASRVTSQLRLAVVARRLRGGGGTDRVASAELATLCVSGTDAIEGLLGRYVPQLALACTVPPVVLVTVAWLDPLSALLLALTLPLVPVFMWLIGRGAAAHAHRRWRTLAVLSGRFLDTVRGLPTLRAFGRGGDQAALVERAADDYRQATAGTLRLAFISGAVLELAATLGVALVAVTVGVRLARGSLGFETALTVLLLAPELYVPLRGLAAQFHATADGDAVVGRLLDEAGVDLPPEPDRPPAPSARGAAVRLEGVTFTYPERDVVVLDSLDLEVGPGERVVLTGSSGAGKSTILSLLLRFAEPQAGRVTVAGIDLAHCDPVSWRAQTAWVPQHPMLVRGTLADNLRLGAPTASDPQVRDAAAAAGLDDVLERLPLGWEEPLGDGARELSAGETRRVAIARALLRDAPLVLVDEPTAHLDDDAADVVVAALTSLADRTMLVATHDPRLLAGADRVVIVDGGTTAVLAQ